MTISNEDTQFEATDEAFFNAAYDGAPVSERPITLDLEAEERETEEGPADPVASELLRARRARLTQAVAEIVATLALMSSTAFGMHLVRGPAAFSPRAAAASSPTTDHAPALSTVAANVMTPMDNSLSAHAPAGDRGEMRSSDASEPSERSHSRSDTRRARPATPDSAARLRRALRRYRPTAGDRSTPGN